MLSIGSSPTILVVGMEESVGGLLRMLQALQYTALHRTTLIGMDARPRNQITKVDQ